MGKAVLAGIFALAASTALAQTDATSKPNTVQEPAVSEQTRTGGPANLCQELLAFMTAPPPEPAPAAAAAPAKPAAESQSAQQATGQAGPAHEAPEPNANAAAGGKAPEPNANAAAGGKAEGAEKTSSLSAPVPKAPATTTKDSVLSIDEAEALASANDIAACQNAARELRLAGVAVPPPLLALTALNLQYQAKTK